MAHVKNKPTKEKLVNKAEAHSNLGQRTWLRQTLRPKEKSENKEAAKTFTRRWWPSYLRMTNTKWRRAKHLMQTNEYEHPQRPFQTMLRSLGSSRSGLKSRKSLWREELKDLLRLTIAHVQRSKPQDQAEEHSCHRHQGNRQMYGQAPDHDLIQTFERPRNIYSTHQMAV